jgi:hypothetical protein
LKDIFMSEMLTLDAQSFSAAVNRLAADATAAAERATASYHAVCDEIENAPGIRNYRRMYGMHRRAFRMNRLAVDARHIVATRLSLLPASATLSLLAADFQQENLGRLAKGGSYSLAGLAQELHWFEIFSKATDPYIAPEDVKRVVRERPSIDPYFRHQPQDMLRPRALLRLLDKSPFGKDLHQKTRDLGIRHIVTDLRSYNLVKRDLGQAPAAGFYHSQRYVFVDGANGDNTIGQALTLVHEDAHGLKIEEHYKARRYKNKKSLGALNGLHGMDESYCRAAELVTLSEWRRTGVVNTDRIWMTYEKHLRHVVPPRHADLLLNDPVGFLHAVTESGVFGEGERFSPKLADRFATSMGRLAMPWRMPQMIVRLPAFPPIGMQML